MKKKLIFNGIIVTAAILVLVTFVMNFWGGNGVILSALTMIQGLFVADSQFHIGDSELMSTLMYQIGTLLATPYIAAIIVIVFGLLKQRWSYLVTAAMTMVEIVFLLLDVFWLIPKRLSDSVEGVTEGIKNIPYIGSFIIENAGGVMEMTSYESLRNFLVSGLGPAFWIALGAFLCIMTISICAFLTVDDKEINKWKQKDPEIICFCGELAGVHIPMKNDEKLIIGSDAASCNLILRANKIDRKHCMIRYLAKSGEYQLTNYSEFEFYVNEHGFLDVGEDLHDGGTITVARGSRIELGELSNVLFLD